MVEGRGSGELGCLLDHDHGEEDVLDDEEGRLRRGLRAGRMGGTGWLMKGRLEGGESGALGASWYIYWSRWRQLQSPPRFTVFDSVQPGPFSRTTTQPPPLRLHAQPARLDSLFFRHTCGLRLPRKDHSSDVGAPACRDSLQGGNHAAVVATEEITKGTEGSDDPKRPSHRRLPLGLKAISTLRYQTLVYRTPSPPPFSPASRSRPLSWVPCGRLHQALSADPV